MSERKLRETINNNKKIKIEHKDCLRNSELMQGSMKKNISKRNQQNLVIGKATTKANRID